MYNEFLRWDDAFVEHGYLYWLSRYSEQFHAEWTWTPSPMHRHPMMMFRLHCCLLCALVYFILTKTPYFVSRNDGNDVIQKSLLLTKYSFYISYRPDSFSVSFLLDWKLITNIKNVQHQSFTSLLSDTKEKKNNELIWNKKQIKKKSKR